MRSLGLSVHFKRLAFALSLLALWAALLAPAALLAKDLDEGRWMGLCSAAQGGAAVPEDLHEGHCGLCVLPGPALPPGPAAVSAANSGGAAAWVWPKCDQALATPARPLIRGPPRVL